MSSGNRRIAITGLGIVTPLGADAGSVMDRLFAGDCAVGPVSAFNAAGFPVQIAAECRDFDVKPYLEKSYRKQLRVLSRPIQFGLAATSLALSHARFEKDKTDPLRLSVKVGMGFMPSDPNELIGLCEATVGQLPCEIDYDRLAEGMARMEPLWMLRYLPNMLGCHISVVHNAQGPLNTLTNGDLAGLTSIIEAVRTIKSGRADHVITGGSECHINLVTYLRYNGYGHLSRQNDHPETACRPFDVRRSGTVVGEGAGMLLLEDFELATRRGAEILGEIVGVGTATCRDIGRSVTQAVTGALRHAGISPADIDHVNAHGLGADEFDRQEAQGLQAIFGSRTPVWSLKGHFGNLASAAGPVELAASLLAMRRGEVPATLNCREKDPACDVAVTQCVTPVRRNHFVKVGFADYGQCAALVCRANQVSG